MRNRRTQINKEIRSLYQRHHQTEQIHVRIVVTVSEIPHRLVVGHENINTLENSSVLNYNILGISDFQDILKPLGQEINLQIERPPLDILIVILQIWVVCDRLEFWGPAIMFCQHAGQCRFAAAYISCYSDVHYKIS